MPSLSKSPSLTLIFVSEEEKQKFMDHLLEIDWMMGYNDEVPFYDLEILAIMSLEGNYPDDWDVDFLI